MQGSPESMNISKTILQLEKEPVWLTMCNIMDACIHLSEFTLIAEPFFWFTGFIIVYLDLMQFPKTNLGTECPHSLSTEVQLGQHVSLPPSSAWVAENYRRLSLEGGSEGHPLFLLEKGKTPADKLGWVFFFRGRGNPFERLWTEDYRHVTLHSASFTKF